MKMRVMAQATILAAETPESYSERMHTGCTCSKVLGDAEPVHTFRYLPNEERLAKELGPVSYTHLTLPTKA